MAVALSLKVEGLQELERRVARIDPSRNPRWVSRALVESAKVVQAQAAEREIARGTRPAPGQQVSVLPNRLTGRTGALQGSIRINRPGLPRYIDIGSDLEYAAIHEQEGRPGTTRTITKRSSRGTSFQATYPARPFLGPALNKASRRAIPNLFRREWQREIRRA